LNSSEGQALKKKLWFVLILFLISGCKGPFSPVPTIEMLISSHEQIEVDGRKYILEAYLWRDFMPISPPDGKPLIALIWVTAVDLLPFPTTLDADRLWVINGQQVWEAEFSNEELPENSDRKHQLEKIARSGPKWGPGLYVDVVVRIVDCKNKEYLLRASKQYIGRTD